MEGFDDFTLASSWERFISEIEAVCRLWLADDPKKLMEKGAECMGNCMNLYNVKCELKYGVKLYSMEYYFKISSNGKSVDWDDGLHNLQLSFGVSDFLVIAPVSASGVVLDAPESCKLLSAVTIALSNCGSKCPAFVPVHDPSRKAYIGIQNTDLISTRRFEADRIGSQVPVRLMHLEGLYELFVSKFISVPNKILPTQLYRIIAGSGLRNLTAPASAAVPPLLHHPIYIFFHFFFEQALSSIDFSTNCFKVNFTMKLTYRTPPCDEEEDITSAETEVEEMRGDPDKQDHIKIQWDDDCPWTEWYSAEDPIKGFELTAIWSCKTFESSLEMAELENASSVDAEKWFLYPILSSNITDDSAGKLIGFASQLQLLVRALEVSSEAQFLEDYVSSENPGSVNTKHANAIPPPTVTDRVLKEIFHDGTQGSDYTVPENRKSRAIKGAPFGSLFAQFCLHSLWFGNCNIRAIAAIWIEFVREVHWCWEESQPLPRMSTEFSIDLSTCLIHQKLQMLAICIAKKSLLNQDRNNSTTVKDNILIDNEVDFQDEKNRSINLLDEGSVCKHGSSPGLDNHHDSLKTHICPVDSVHVMAPADVQRENNSRRGSAGVVGSMMLLHSFQKMHTPYTQDAPVMTEDMHEERLRAVEAFENAFGFSGQLERDILSSDMSAFKAANPDAVFEDFIRWHSPGDWEDDETETPSNIEKMQSLPSSWPPIGRLSQRMSEHGNSWRQIWNEAPILPASEQKPLFDPIREGEKVIHYLETLKPYQLLEQMVCTAFRASADTLNQTTYGDLKLMKTKVNQLYITLASTLKPLQANYLLDKADLIGDLQKLCVLFEHIEKLLIVAASVHRKLLDTPRLSEAIFNGCFNFYLPKMGTSLTSVCYEKEFNVKELVKLQERDAVMSLFPHPTANQSWRKVISMGNLLNGHEPALREIIFSVNDTESDIDNYHYGSSVPSASAVESETHRMYIRGTSNDLQVSLSVTSWD